MSLSRNPFTQKERSVSYGSECRTALSVLVVSLLAWLQTGIADAQTVADPAAASIELQTLIEEAQTAIASNRPAAGIPLASQAREIAVALRGDNHPDVLFTTNLLATSYALSGRYEDANPLFSAVLEQLNAQSNAPTADKMVAHFNLADLQVLQRRWGLASENFEAALSIATALGQSAQQYQIDAQSGLARISMVLGDWESAHAQYGELLARAPSSPDAAVLPVSEWRQKRAEALSRAGEHAAAETAFAQILEEAAPTGPFAQQVRTEFAEALLRSGKLASAEAEFDAVSQQISMGSAAGRRALEGLGDVRRARGRTDQAESAYTDWINALDSIGRLESAEGRRAWLKLARLYVQTNRKGEAAELYQRILSAETGNAVVGQSVRASARLELADLMFEERAFEEADALYQYVMDRSERLFGLSDQTHRYALERLAFVRQATGRTQDAERLHLNALTNRAVFEQDCSTDCALQLAAFAAVLGQADGIGGEVPRMKSEALQALSEVEPMSAAQRVKLEIAFPEGLRVSIEQTRDQLFDKGQQYQAIRLSPALSAPDLQNAPTAILAPLNGADRAQESAVFGEPEDDALNLQRLHGALVPYLHRLKQDEVELTGIEYERFTVLKASYASLVDGARNTFRQRLLSSARTGQSEASARRRLMAAVTPGTAFLSLNLRSDAIHVAFITPERAVHRRVVRSPTLERDILNSRLAIAYEGRGFGNFNSTARLQTLYRALLSQFSAELVSVRGLTLVIDAHGPLRYVPFAALHDGQSYLAENHPTALAAAPNVASLSGLRPGRDLTRFAASDDPAMRSLFAGLGFQGQIFAGEAYDTGTLANVAASGPDILQIESQLTLDGQNPNLSSLSLSNGGIPVQSVLATIGRSAENIDLVALVGAATLSELSQDQGVEGSRLGSGADLAAIYSLASNPEIGAMTVSLWPLSAAHRTRLLEEFYTGWTLSNESLSQALNSAQLAALDNEETANPYHWASLTLAYGSE